MKKIFLATAIIAVIVFAGCGSSPKATGADELDIAIREASDYLNDNIPNGNKIVILNIQSSSADLSDYVIDEMIANAVNDKLFSVVDRAQLDLIREEQKIQYSGEVDDNAALEIGKFLGAQTIVSGAVSALGNGYRMRIRALDVLTAQVQGQFNRNIAAGSTINMLMASRSGSGPSVAGSQAVSGRSGSSGSGTASGGGTQTATPAAATHKIGDTGPAGGIVFYDKGNNQGGWRYLEAAPADVGPKRVPIQGDSIIFNSIKERSVGWGKRNTAEIMRVANSSGGGFGWAAQLADSYEYNGFDDWYLPSRDELKWMYGNLHLKGLGGFYNDWYLSSTSWEGSETLFSYLNFSNGEEDYWNGNRIEGYTRPIRQF